MRNEIQQILLKSHTNTGGFPGKCSQAHTHTHTLTHKHTQVGVYGNQRPKPYPNLISSQKPQCIGMRIIWNFKPDSTSTVIVCDRARWWVTGRGWCWWVREKGLVTSRYHAGSRATLVGMWPTRWPTHCDQHCDRHCDRHTVTQKDTMNSTVTDTVWYTWTIWLWGGVWRKEWCMPG